MTSRRLTHRQALTILRAAALYYHEQLLQSPQALAYLGETRGYAEPAVVAERYGLGYAPTRGEGRGLVRALAEVGAALGLQDSAWEAALETVGLVRRTERGLRDTFRGRLLFPFLRKGGLGAFGWRDEKAEVVAFGGRLVPWAVVPGFEAPKYLNSPETPWFSKRELPFGLFPWAVPGVRSEQRVFVVEGYFDFLRLHTLGITNVVAVCGTSLTAGHLQAILAARGTRRPAPEIFVMTDSDVAGRTAADRAARVITDLGLVARLMPAMASKDVDATLQGVPAAAAVAQVREWVAAAEWPMMVGLPAADDAAWTRSLAALHLGFRRLRRFAATTPVQARDEVLAELAGRLRLHGRLSFGTVHLRQVLEGGGEGAAV